MDFTEYIKPELLILIPVLYVIGMAVKKTALIADKLIPLVVGAIGILLSVIYVLATTALGSPQAIAMAIFTALTQGVYMQIKFLNSSRIIIQTVRSKQRILQNHRKIAKQKKMKK